MDAGRFDGLSRSFANRRSRRSALKGLGLAGVAAVVRAEHAPAASGACALPIVATTAVGPHKDTTYSGTLNLEIGDNGAIDGGSFDLDTGTSLPLVGQATGRVLNLRVALSDGGILALNGTADIDLVLCRGDASGVIGGPDDTDLGTWRTGNNGTSGSSNGSSGGGTSTSGGTTSVPAGGSTSNDQCPAPQIPCGPNCCPGGGTCTDANQGLCTCPDNSTQCGFTCVPNCPGDQTLDLDRCTCSGGQDCPAPTVACGAVCCPSGSVCTDEANGECSCPDGTELCIDTCVPSCEDGNSPDPNTCECGAQQGGGGCVQPLVNCGDSQNVQCTDLTSDAQNCGSCGTVCSANQICVGNVCIN
jgi:hypothetical protein